ncbi:MAG: tRNA (guanosine(46)-N7)-methyltransferase TrmB [Spirochaetota bacterium]
MSIKISEEQKLEAFNKHLIEQSAIDYNWEPISLFNEKLIALKHIEKVAIEIGSGNGDFLIHTAKNNPENLYIGLEIKRKRILKCVFKSYKRDINNIGFVYGDAKIILISKKIKESSIDEYYLTFPDPWPKKRHRKHRIFTNEFLDTIYKSLKPKGTFTIATDDKEYFENMIKTIDYHSGFSYLFENKVSNKLEGFYKSYFEQLWREKGKEINYCIIIAEK